MTAEPMHLVHESKRTLRLAFPLIIGQLSQMLLGVADTVMIGKLGVTELAALTFANAVFHVPFVFGIGLLTAVSVFTSNAKGSNDPEAARASCRNGTYLALAIGTLLFAAAWLISLRLDLFGQPEAVTARTPAFFRILMASIIPGLAALALKNHADALNRPWPPFWIFMSGVALNIGLNWLLIYGHFGFPAMKLTGAATATFISRTLVLIAMIVWLLHAHGLREWVPYRWFRRPDFTAIRRLLGIGWPASLHMLCEVAAFSTSGLIIGRFGSTPMAAHQVAITCAATAFMIPLGLSMALTVRIGEANGAGLDHQLRPIAISGWLLATIIALMTAATFLLFGKNLTSLFISNKEVISLAASLLIIVGIFQLVDSLQVVSGAMLRGLHDAHVPALMGFISYWLVGLPLAIALGFHFHLGTRGVWWGLAGGLSVACLTLGPRLWLRTKPPQAAKPHPASR
ncbi:MATE family efflux transporter [Luteolibacter pohnpeiensis]|uniref:Multidrug-efflux transporter n=1 Tax=Luteolibacter pohnpeiensis TaxID=454153 RepID=A0A934VUX4_9BACT|nr:MATE family efflux transporter [Luteolibacter pohnpeiensis]MBK1880954.1 MATE family efflux transporter [Luteolibacter pohnpeiensis]